MAGTGSRSTAVLALAVALLAAVVLLVPAADQPPGAPAADDGSAGAVGAGDPYYPTDGNGGYQVAEYDVAISYDPATRQLDGDARITARSTQRLSRFDLDLVGLAVRSVTVSGQPAAFARSGDHELVITPPSGIPDGVTFPVEVRYGGVPGQVRADPLGRGGWQFSDTGGAFAAGEPHSASTWYPVNDTPRDKARFHLDVRVPDGWSAIGNGRERAPDSAGGWTTFHWVEDTPVASYLTTVAIDRWTIRRSALPDGTPVVDAYAPGAENKRAAEDRLPEVLAFLAEKFGPYPQDAAGGIFLADDIRFSLETQTRPTYARWSDLITIVHENTHQWLGDSVTVRNWADICLNECFASYAQWLWSEAKEGQDLDSRYRAALAKVGADPTFWNRELYDMGPGHEFSAVYDKGILALHALRRQVGDQAFFAICRGWPRAHRDGWATWPDFERYAQQVSGQDLGGFFTAWFHQRGVPAAQYLWPAALHP